MTPAMVTLLLFAVLILVLITGLPISFVLGGVATVFVLLLWGSKALMIISASAYGMLDNFVLVAAPLFIFMGMVLERSGIADSLYTMMYRWIGGLRGGLAVGTVIICTVFAAMTGISGAATVTMGVIALPSMLRHNYDKEIAVGCISAGGALGVLIPPSTLMILYGIFAQVSIGQLFAAGIFPGLVLSSLFITYIIIRCRIQPHLGPSVPLNEKATWEEKFVSLKGVILPIFLIILVLGTIFMGVTTPTEAAAMGALGSLVCAAIHRKLNWGTIKESSYQTLRVACMLVWIIIGGVCFTRVYTAIGAIDFMRETITALPVSPYLILVGMQFLLIFLGMLMDPGGIIMITTPVFVPIISTMGFDPVWFGALFIVNMEMGYLTPPFGFNLFYMKAIVPKSISMGDIYRSITPFVCLQLIGLVLLIVFPQIALWAPSMLFR
ncbi:TRAP transporter large permease subunit [Chloroflexota bacterium]